MVTVTDCVTDVVAVKEMVLFSIMDCIDVSVKDCVRVIWKAVVVPIGTHSRDTEVSRCENGFVPLR